MEKTENQIINHWEQYLGNLSITDSPNEETIREMCQEYSREVLKFVEKWFCFNGEKYYARPISHSEFVDWAKTLDFKTKKRQYTFEEVVKMYQTQKRIQ